MQKKNAARKYDFSIINIIINIYLCYCFYSQGIDSFFKRVPSKKTSDEDATSPPTPAPRKRKALAISSDEDEVPASPQISKHGKELKKSRRTHDATDNGHATKKPSLSKLKEPPKQLKKVDPTELFGGETTRIEAPKPKERSLIELEDEDIDRSLMEVDVDDLIPSPAVSRKRSKASSPTKTPKDEAKTPKVEAKTPKVEAKTPKSEAKTTKAKTPKQEKHVDLESSVLSDEERHERKRMAAVLYQKYKNRSSCLNPGSKEIPKGSPDCLKGLTFLVTGILESMERDEAASVIKGFGGRVMTVVGKKLNYLVVGEEAGPKKLAQAEEFHVTILSEDGLFDLIREKSGETVKAKSSEVKQEKNSSPKIKNEHEKSNPKVKKEHKEKISPEIKREQEEKSSSKIKRELEEKSSSVIAKQEHEHKSSSKIKKDPDELNSNGFQQESSSNGFKMKTEQSSSSQIKREPNNNVADVKEEDVSMNMALVDKYKPTSIKDIVGQAGANSNVTK